MAFQSPWMVRSAALRRCALKLGEGLLDRVEVSAVRREAEEASASGLDHLAYRRSLVARQVVHDHDVAGAKLRHEHLSDIGVKGVAVD